MPSPVCACAPWGVHLSISLWLAGLSSREADGNFAACAAIGSGGGYALAASRALYPLPDMDALAIGALLLSYCLSSILTPSL